jgi:DNA-binding transcriptional ArsR family regulator
MKPITNIDDPRYVKAMSHPLRVRILAMLDERTASPVELAGWLGSSLGTVAYHVRTLQTIDAYARAASAAGGFDHGNSHLTRTQLTLDARGWADLSRACLRLLSQVDRIDESARERIELNPHSGDTKDVALVMMLFEAARLAAETEGDPVAERRRRHRRPVGPTLVD